MKNKSIEMKPILLIDSNFLCYRAYFTLPNDLSVGEVKTYILFGFLQEVIRLSKQFQTDRFMFFFDSRVSYRKQVYSKYKANRKTEEPTEEEKAKKKEFYDQVALLKTEILEKLGFQVFEQEGYESDDLIASYTKSFIGKEDKPNIVIVSSDKDLYQLINWNVSFYSPIKKEVYTRQMFYDEWGVDPCIWAEIKAYAGCSTDNVIGISKIGEKTAAKFIKGEIKKDSKTYKKFIGKHIKLLFNRNLKLVRLPYKGKKPIKKIEFFNHIKFNENFMEVFEQWNILTFLRNFDEWKTNFNLQ